MISQRKEKKILCLVNLFRSKETQEFFSVVKVIQLFDKVYFFRYVRISPVAFKERSRMIAPHITIQ